MLQKEVKSFPLYPYGLVIVRPGITSLLLYSFDIDFLLSDFKNIFILFDCMLS